MFARFQRTGDKGLSWLDTTHQFDHDGNVLVFNDLIDIGHKVVVMTSSLQFFLFSIISNQDLSDLDFILSCLGDFFMVFF